MRLLTILFTLMMLPVGVYAKNAEFPGRDLYLDVKYIEMQDLGKEFDQAVIVDVRSPYEFNTIHVKNAMNIPLNASDYVKKMKDLRQANPDKKIVTYCNGKTCMKSYKAARKCQQRGIKGVYAFDAGIMDWARAYPERSVLLGKSPLDTSQLIEKKQFKKHLLKTNDFINKVNSTKRSIIVDARDPLQREGLSLFVNLEQRASLQDTEAMDKLIDQAVAQNKPMFIYDEAGKQVRWLMYRLQAKGVKEFYFLEGGMKSYFKQLREEMNQ